MAYPVAPHDLPQLLFQWLHQTRPQSSSTYMTILGTTTHITRNPSSLNTSWYLKRIVKELSLISRKRKLEGPILSRWLANLLKNATRLKHWSRNNLENIHRTISMLESDLSSLQLQLHDDNMCYNNLIRTGSLMVTRIQSSSMPWLSIEGIKTESINCRSIWKFDLQP